MKQKSIIPPDMLERVGRYATGWTPLENVPEDEAFLNAHKNILMIAIRSETDTLMDGLISLGLLDDFVARDTGDPIQYLREVRFDSLCTNVLQSEEHLSCERKTSIPAQDFAERREQDAREILLSLDGDDALTTLFIRRIVSDYIDDTLHPEFMGSFPHLNNRSFEDTYMPNDGLGNSLDGIKYLTAHHPFVQSCYDMKLDEYVALEAEDEILNPIAALDSEKFDGEQYEQAREVWLENAVSPESQQNNRDYHEGLKKEAAELKREMFGDQDLRNDIFNPNLGFPKRN